MLLSKSHASLNRFKRNFRRILGNLAGLYSIFPKMKC
uniref:Uncharacterized protein n=1 Tax=Anguilla anguilla TaxID=7936 RepID=A0A0E9U390_ANGAN